MKIYKFEMKGQMKKFMSKWKINLNEKSLSPNEYSNICKQKLGLYTREKGEALT